MPGRHYRCPPSVIQRSTWAIFHAVRAVQAGNVTDPPQVVANALPVVADALSEMRRYKRDHAHSA